jgi:cell division protein FtsQ
LLVVAAPWWLPVALSRLDYFAVRRVEVVGARYHTPEQVTGSLLLEQSANVFQDLEQLERRLVEQPGIGEARVTRRLPGVLRVEVVEVEPVALLEGGEALVPVSAQGRPLPYDPVVAPVDAPVVARPDRGVLSGLAAVRSLDPGIYAAVSTARRRGGELVLDLEEGVLRLALPVDAAAVRSVSAVRRDFAARGAAWAELDARFRGWVVARPRRGEERGNGSA